jgi:hypothetical protein
MMTVSLYYKIPWQGMSLIAFASFLIFLLDFAESKQKQFLRGESGELKVAEVLSKIPEIKYYRGLTIDGSKADIDFVVISQAGVFVLEVKTYDGRVTANGDVWKTYIKNKRVNTASFSTQAKQNAVRLRSYLERKCSLSALPYFNAVVVLVNPFDKSAISINNCHYQVCSPEELKTLFVGHLDEKSRELASVFDTEFS